MNWLSDHWEADPVLLSHCTAKEDILRHQIKTKSFFNDENKMITTALKLFQNRVIFTKYLFN